SFGGWSHTEWRAKMSSVFGPFRAFAGFAMFAALGAAAHAQVSALVGYDALMQRLGAGNYPTGAGVVVGQVEAQETPGNYGPDQSNSEFIGKTFTAMSGPPGSSSHATLVGQNYYGTVTSVAPGVTSIFLYEAGSWATTAYLQSGQGGINPPLATPGG